MEKILLDTDMGSDIDDAFALSYLLNNDNCELLGITTCTGESKKRAELCSLFLDISKKNHVPICVGIDNPLCNVNHQPSCPQAAVLCKHNQVSNYTDKNVAEFINEIIEENDGDITLVAIGPLTNIALAITLYPTIVKKLKRLVLMGGKVDTSVEKMGRVDWNFICDPHAAKIVLDADFKEVVIYPCDVTYSLNHSKEYMHENLKGRFSPLIKEMAEIWFERFNEYSYHDPMASMYPFLPEISEIEVGKMRVDLSMSIQLGLTQWSGMDTGNHLLVKDINREIFIKELYGTINK